MRWAHRRSKALYSKEMHWLRFGTGVAEFLDLGKCSGVIRGRHQQQCWSGTANQVCIAKMPGA